MGEDVVPKAIVRGSLPPFSETGADPNAPATPLYAMYSPGQVALASFFGSALAGCWLLARNYKRLRKPRTGWLCVGLGALVTAGLVAMAMADVPVPLGGVVAVIAMRAIASALQGQAFERHLALGGRRASSWAAFGIAMAFLASIFVVAVGIGVAYLYASYPSRVAVASGGEVLYRDGATETNAEHLRDVLVELKYFDEAPSTVMIARPAGRFEVSFVVFPVATIDSEIQEGFEALADPISRAFGNEPVDIVLIDDELKPQRHFRWDGRRRSLMVGDTEFRFRDGEVTEAQVRAVSQTLTDVGYLRDGGKTTVSIANTGRIRITLLFEPAALDARMWQLVVHNWARALSHDAFGDAPVDLAAKTGTETLELEWEHRPNVPIRFGQAGEVWHLDGGTVDEARAIAKLFETDSPVDRIFVMRDAKARPVVAFEVDAFEVDAAWNRKLHESAAVLSRGVFANQPVDLWLTDASLTARRILAWEDRPKVKARR